MTDSWDDVRDSIAEEKHYRGRCESGCSWCEDEAEEDEIASYGKRDPIKDEPEYLDDLRYDESRRATDATPGRDEADRSSSGNGDSH